MDIRKENSMNKIEKIEEKIEQLIYSIVNDDTYRSPRAEERLTALCLARQYMKDKEREYLDSKDNKLKDKEV